MTPAESIARAVLRIFRAQKAEADNGTESFGRWHARLTAALDVPIVDTYRQGGKRAKAPADMADDLVSAAKERALFTARSINDTSSQWIEEGREPEDVFSADRAASIGLTEQAYAVHQTVALVAQKRGQKLTWRIAGGACEFCRKMEGRTRAAGKSFGKDKFGNLLYHPPAHANCDCSLQITGKPKKPVRKKSYGRDLSPWER